VPEEEEEEQDEEEDGDAMELDGNAGTRAVRSSSNSSSRASSTIHRLAGTKPRERFRTRLIID